MQTSSLSYDFWKLLNTVIRGFQNLSSTGAGNLWTCCFCIKGPAGGGRDPGEEDPGHPAVGGGVEADHPHGWPQRPLRPFLQCQSQEPGEKEGGYSTDVVGRSQVLGSLQNVTNGLDNPRRQVDGRKLFSL